MAGSGVTQSSFTAGELAPALYGRVDFARYYTGAKTIRNMIVRQYGGVTNRAGTWLVDRAISSANKGRLIPFEFSSSQSYVLEFSDHKMRIIKDGGLVIWPDHYVIGALYVTPPFPGTPVEISTPYAVADLPLLKYTQSADVMTLTHPLYPTQKLSRRDHFLWTLEDDSTTGGPFKDINVNPSVTVTASAIIGSIVISSNTDLFLPEHVGLLFYLEQSPDGLTPKWEVQKAVEINAIKRAGVNYYIARNAGTTGTVRPTTTEGVEYDGDPGVAWEYIHSGSGIVRITGYNSPTSVNATVLTRLPENVITGTASREVQSFTAGSPATTTGDPPHTVPAVDVRCRCDAHGLTTGQNATFTGCLAGIDGTWAVIVIDVNNLQIVGCYVTDVSGYAGGGHAGQTLVAVPTYKWAFGAWGGPFKYPGCAGYTQERRVYGGSYDAPHTFWMSRSQGFDDFGVTIPLVDDDAITYRINSRKVTEIRHFVELAELIVLTSDGPFMIRGGQDGVIAPGKISRKKQGARGVSHVPPLVIGDQALYVQEKGQQVRSLDYVFATDKFTGVDLTVIAHHLFRGRKIVDWCYQEVPFSCVWVILDNGALLTLTYMPEQDVIAWSHHDTDGIYESCACITESGQDTVYFQVLRPSVNEGPVRFIEKMAPRLYDDPAEAFFVDCGLSYHGAPVSRVAGLDHLTGKTVSILADGNVHPQRVVDAGGGVDLQDAYSVIHVGLPYVSDLETLDLANPQTDVREKKKLIAHVSLIVEGSRRIWCGPDADSLTEAKREAFKTYKDTSNETTGLLDLRIQATWEKSGRVFCRQIDPLPLSILGVIPEVTYGGV